MTSCEICGGAGVKEIDTKLYECECAELRRIAASMPSYIRTARAREGHLSAMADKNTRIIDAVNKSLYITAYWNDMRAFIKLVMLTHRNKFIRIISDRELRDVFVGSTNRVARGEDSKEPVYNSIEDLVKSPSLLMIRLNELSYKNKAAPGILEEALSYRLDRNEPVWLLSNAAKRFGSGSIAYSEAVWSLIQSMPNILVPAISPIDGPIDASAPTIVSVSNSHLAPEPTVSQEVTATPKPKMKPKVVRSASDDDEDLGGLAVFGSGVKPGRRL